MTGFRNPLAAWMGGSGDPDGAKRFAGQLYRQSGLVVFVLETLPPHQRSQVQKIAEENYGKRTVGR